MKPKKLKYRILCLISCSLLLCTHYVYSQEDYESKIVALPLKEVTGVVKDWFLSSGFQVSLNTLKMGRTKVTAHKNETRLSLYLTPNSPLATQISYNKIDWDQNHQKIDLLWQYVDAYIDGQPIPKKEKKTIKLSIPNIILQRIETVVCIKTMRGSEPIQFSGFIIDPEGIVLSTAHGLKTITALTVIDFSGKEYRANVLKMDHHLDLLLIKVDTRFSSFVSIKDGRKLLGMGEALYSAGCPKDLGGTVYPGMINGPPRRVDGVMLWQVDMQVYPGGSGSPVFDKQGNLAGIVKGRYRGTDYIGFLIPFSTIIEFLEVK